MLEQETFHLSQICGVPSFSPLYFMSRTTSESSMFINVNNFSFALSPCLNVLVV